MHLGAERCPIRLLLRIIRSATGLCNPPVAASDSFDDLLRCTFLPQQIARRTRAHVGNALPDWVHEGVTRSVTDGTSQSTQSEAAAACGWTCVRAVLAWQMKRAPKQRYGTMHVGMLSVGELKCIQGEELLNAKIACFDFLDFLPHGT